jgi:hypothetical protein
MSVANTNVSKICPGLQIAAVPAEMQHATHNNTLPLHQRNKASRCLHVTEKQLYQHCILRKRMDRQSLGCISNTLVVMG